MTLEYPKTFDPGLLLNSIYDGIVAIDAEAIISFFNKTAEGIFNIPAHGALNRHVLDILPNMGSKLIECLNSGNPFYGEKLKWEHNTYITNITPVVSNQKISGAISLFHNISEIENILREFELVRNLKNWLDTVIDSSYDGLWICDRQGNIIRINKAAEKLNDVKAEEVIGRNMRELVAEGIIDQSVTLEVLKKRKSITTIQKIKGQKRILVTSNPIFNEKGEIAFVVSNERDIEELDNLRSQLQQSQALARVYSSKLSELELRGIDFSNLIFRSAEMERVIEMAIRVAAVNSTVLIIGESGVGKGIIARLIHKHSERSKGPFIRVDCAGIPDSLVESELFGYEKGAFTGAKTEGKPGLLELAHGGTLFLDEIGEIPLSSQSKLLHFLEDHEITRLGGTEPQKINVRVITATNRNLEEMVSSKLFRKDLYYRLNVVPIHILPIRDRKEDIPALVSHFLEKFNETYHRPKTLSPQVVDLLCKYELPGNVRELANLIERLVVLSEKDRIEVNDLPDVIQKSVPPIIPDLIFPFEGLPLKKALEKCEGIILERALKKFGSQRKASEILQVTQATISRKFKRLYTHK